MKIIIYLACAANGLISNSRNVPDWLSPEYETGFINICQRTQAVIMGKTTYKILAGAGFLPLTNSGTLVVLTHDTKTTPPQDNLVFTDLSPAAIVQFLQSKGHTEAVIIGGTQAVSAFVDAGLVNEVILIVEPVLFGMGLPMLAAVEQEVPLALKTVQQLSEKTVQLHYEVKTN